MKKITFPFQGLNENQSFENQPKGTSPTVLNVRAYDALQNRVRGGQRPGLSKWGDGDDIGSTNAVIAITSVTFMELQ